MTVFTIPPVAELAVVDSTSEIAYIFKIILKSVKNRKFKNDIWMKITASVTKWKY